jgi:hypothetical protein
MSLEEYMGLRQFLINGAKRKGRTDLLEDMEKEYLTVPDPQAIPGRLFAFISHCQKYLEKNRCYKLDDDRFYKKIGNRYIGWLKEQPVFTIWQMPLKSANKEDGSDDDQPVGLEDIAIKPLGEIVKDQEPFLPRRGRPKRQSSK